MAESLIQIKNLSVQFKTPESDIQAVRGVSFDVHRGQNIAIVGESGSGKSVTALSILRLHEAAQVKYPSGEIIFQGNDLLTCSEQTIRSVRGRDIAMIFQEPTTSLNPVYPVGDQLIEPLMLHKSMTKDQAKKRVIELLDRVGIPEPQRYINSFPHMMSGGQRQRVMIAMALACNPKLLIADEPTTALDVTIQKQILELLADLQKEFNMSVLMITHDLNLVRHYSEYVCVMKQGEIVEQAETQKLFNQPIHQYTKILLESEPDRIIDEIEMDQSSLIEATNLKVYFPVTKGFFKRKIDEVKAVDQVNLRLASGETLGIVGESGSGKTTLGMSLLKLEQSTGEIIFDGVALHELGEASIRPLRKEFQVVFQDPFSSLSPRMTVEQIIGEGLKLHFPELSKQQRYQRIINILNEVGLDESVLWRYPHEFSGGQRQRIAIARVVILEPKLILLDEPTSALDVSVQKQVLELLVKLQKAHDLSYIFISHDLKVIRAISHRVMVMKDGQVVEEGETEMLFNQASHVYTQNLLQAALI
ncbi:MAG: ABC transporter ATP-binding protein [Gammaproteobacteria bacterium]|nr:ABC transporter ATP-binding protein [Gammaproteobacteria bacterium]